MQGKIPSDYVLEMGVDRHDVRLLTSPSRRLTSRVEAAQGVWVYWNSGGHDDIARVHDLSMGGVFIETPKPNEIGTKANLHFLAPDGQIRAEAVVRHAPEGKGLGLKFVAVREEDRVNLSALMMRLRSLAQGA